MSQQIGVKTSKYNLAPIMFLHSFPFLPHLFHTKNLHSSFHPSLNCLLAFTHLHVSFQLQQLKTVPGNKTRALMREVYTAKAGLAWP